MILPLRLLAGTIFFFPSSTSPSAFSSQFFPHILSNLLRRESSEREGRKECKKGDAERKGRWDKKREIRRGCGEKFEERKVLCVREVMRENVKHKRRRGKEGEK